MYKNLVAIVALFISTTFLAQDDNLIEEKSVQLKFLAGFAAEFGGDSLLDLVFDDGSEQSVNSGQGIYVFAGGELQFAELKQLRVRASVGFKYVTTKATNADISLSRIPIEASVNWMIKDDFRLGAGISSHQAINLNLDGFGTDQSFNGGFGPKFEFAYKWIGISYTIMNYKDAFNNSFNANAFGITLSSSDLF